MSEVNPRVSILVGTPVSQSGVTPAYLHSITALHQRCVRLGWGLDVRTREDGLVSRTRNIFGSRMVHTSQYTHLLMVDADIEFDADVVVRLLTSGLGFVGACVPLREVRWDAVHRAFGEVDDLSPTDLESIAHLYAVAFLSQSDAGAGPSVDGFIPAKYIGGAMTLVKREVFCRLVDAASVTHYSNAGRYADWNPDGWTFFDPLVEPTGGTYLSEDYAFCHRWRALGETVWADIRSRVNHRGNVTVHGDVAQTLNTAARLVKARNASRPEPPE